MKPSIESMSGFGFRVSGLEVCGFGRGICREGWRSGSGFGVGVWRSRDEGNFQIVKGILDEGRGSTLRIQGLGFQDFGVDFRVGV